MKIKLILKYAPVKITDGFDKRRFKINYYEDEIIPRPQMDGSILQSHGVKWRTLMHHDLRQESFDQSTTRLNLTQFNQSTSRLNLTVSPERSRKRSKINLKDFQ